MNKVKELISRYPRGAVVVPLILAGVIIVVLGYLSLSASPPLKRDGKSPDKTQLANLLQTVSQSVEAGINKEVAEIQSRFKTNLFLAALKKPDKKKAREYLKALLTTDIESVVYYDKRGIPGLSYPDMAIGKNAADEDWFQQVVRTAHSYLISGMPQPVMAIPVFDKTVLTGVLWVCYKHKTQPGWLTALNCGASASAYLVNNQGGLISPGMINNPVNLAGQSVVKKALAGQEGIEETTDPMSGEKVLAAYKPLKDFNAAIVVEQPLSRHGAITSSVGLPTGVIVICLVLTVVLIGFSIFASLVVYHRQGVVKEQVRQYNSELNQLRESLRKANQAKLDLVTTVENEVRTPLGKLRQNLGVLLNQPAVAAEPKMREELIMAAVSADRLMRLANNLSDLVRLETGKMELKRRSLDISALLRSLVGTMELYATSRGVTIKTEVPEVLPNITADIDRVLRILTTLVDNGIRFNKTGGSVTVKIRVLNKSFLEVRVEDTGRGLNPQEIQHLMPEKAERDVVTLIKHRSTRLELAVSKAIIELHQGKFGVESQPGAGSKFWFTLPIQPVGGEHPKGDVRGQNRPEEVTKPDTPTPTNVGRHPAPEVPKIPEPKMLPKM